MARRSGAWLARISHQLPAVGADVPHPEVFSRLGLLNVPSSTPPRPSGRKPHWARHLGALATKPGEICGLALTLALLVACASEEARPSVEADFITVRDGTLYEGEDEFRFLSFNIPNLHYIEDDMLFEQPMPFRWPNEYEVDDALESIRQMGGRVVRTYTLSVRKPSDPDGMPRFVLGPGEFNEEGFETLDMVLEVARAKNVRLIIPLVNNWKWWGGVAEYAAFRGKGRDAFWTDPQLIEDFKETVRFVLERVNTRTGIAYKNDPTILAWETGNELHCPHEWTHQIAAFMKELDSNHLVVDGRQEQVLRQDSIDDPYIDLVKTHHYETDPRQMIAHIRQSAAMARGRTSYHVGEFGFLTTAGMTAVMDTIIAEGLAGGLVWSLRSHNRDGGFYWHHEPHGGDLFKAYHWPGFASGEAYDETRLLREMRRRAFLIRGMDEPDLEAPAAPEVIEVTSGGLLTWRGATGAGGYDIQRSESQSTQWQTVARGVSDAAVQYRPLFADESVTPGTSYRYRVVARNDLGPSPPSQPFGPVTMTHRTLVDELANDSRFFLSEGSLEFRNDQARKYKEDAHGLVGDVGAVAVYRTDGPMSGGRVYSFARGAGQRLTFAVSADGIDFASIDPDVESIAAGDTQSYGYQLPIRYRLNDLPEGSRYLRVEFAGDGVRVSRVEIEYGR